MITSDFEAIVSANWTICAITAEDGEDCLQSASWRIVVHGCAEVVMCERHKASYLRAAAEIIAHRKLDCHSCGAQFVTVAAAFEAIPFADTTETVGDGVRLAQRIVQETTIDKTPEHPPAGCSHIDLWLAVLRAEGKSARTVAERRMALSRLERDLGTAATEATPNQLADWLGRNPDERSAATMGTELGHVRAFYQWAIRADMRLDDPTSQIKPPRRPRRTPRPIADAQYRQLDAAAASDPQMRAMVRLAGRAGLRVHEIANFHASDLDIETRRLTVTGKGGHTYVLPAHRDIIEHAKNMPAHGYWFPSQRAPHIGRQLVSQRMRLHMIRCRVKGTAHCLRHYFGTQMVISGVDLRVVQELMRHANLSTTALYIEVSDQRMRTAINTLGILQPGADAE